MKLEKPTAGSLKQVFQIENLIMSFPNQLTVFRIILTPLLAVVVIFDGLAWKYVSLSIFILASLTDWYDGYAARKFGKITSTGKYLDPLADKLLVSTAFGIFAYLGLIKLWMFFVMASRDLLITGFRAYAISQGRPMETSNFAKWKTACQMFAIYLLFIWLIARAHYPGDPAPAILQKIEDWQLIYNLMFFVTLYTLATGVSYLVVNRRHLKNLIIAFYRVFVPTNIR